MGTTVRGWGAPTVSERLPAAWLEGMLWGAVTAQTVLICVVLNAILLWTLNYQRHLISSSLSFYLPDHHSIPLLKSHTSHSRPARIQLLQLHRAVPSSITITSISATLLCYYSQTNIFAEFLHNHNWAWRVFVCCLLFGKMAGSPLQLGFPGDSSIFSISSSLTGPFSLYDRVFRFKCVHIIDK